MARTSEVSRGQGATMFLVDAENPGFQVVREIPTLDHAMIGGHCEVVFEDCVVEEAASSASSTRASATRRCGSRPHG